MKPSSVTRVICFAATLTASGYPRATSGEDAPGASKAAWEWSDEDRIAARFAAGAVKARHAAMLARYGKPAGKIPLKDVVDGATDPQLFLPIEIFENFTHFVTRPDSREAHDEVLWRATTTYQLPPDFENILRRQTAGYMRVFARSARLPEIMPSAGKDVCLALRGALENMQRELGPERWTSFLKFLYAEVAPGMARVTPGSAESGPNQRRFNQNCEGSDAGDDVRVRRTLISKGNR